MVTIQNNENGNQVQAKIVDECPGCAWGSLDMSPAVFGDLNNGSESHCTGRGAVY